MTHSTCLRTSAFVLILLIAGPIYASNPTDQLPSSTENTVITADPETGEPQFPPRKPEDPGLKEMNRKMQQERQKQNYRELKRDAERLLEVATELKQYVDKANEQVLSLEVLRKAEQMEKLAKDLKNRMKGQ